MYSNEGIESNIEIVAKKVNSLIFEAGVMYLFD